MHPLHRHEYQLFLFGIELTLYLLEFSVDEMESSDLTFRLDQPLYNADNRAYVTAHAI